MRFLAGDQEIQVLLHRLGRQGTEALAFLERQLEHGTAQVVEQDDQVVGVDQGLFGRAPKEVIGMVGQELVERAGGGHQDCQGGLVAAPGPSGLLPGAGDGARVPDQQRCAQAADVYAQFEGVGGNHGPDRPIPQAFFDGAALGGQVAAAVAADGDRHQGDQVIRYPDIPIPDCLVPGYLVPADTSSRISTERRERAKTTCWIPCAFSSCERRTASSMELFRSPRASSTTGGL